MIRRAKIKDVRAIVDLVNFYSAKGEMLSRSQTQIFHGLRDFVVAEDDDTIIGCGALAIIWHDIAEIRSLAIVPEHAGQGWGRKVVEYLLNEARDLEMPRVFTLTYKPGFFEKLGFTRVEKKDLPHKVWKDCLHCPKFPDCDEVALIRPLQ